jgi:hypothetical protein
MVMDLTSLCIRLFDIIFPVIRRYSYSVYMLVRHDSRQELPGTLLHAPFQTAPSGVAYLPEYSMNAYNNIPSMYLSNYMSIINL